MDVPAYTEFPQDISYKPCNIRRYTMEDIGDLDGRLTEVEKKSMLNESEIESLKKSVSNLENTTEFLVALQNDDLGAGHKGAVVDSNEHNCAVGGGVLQPPTSGAFINLDISSADDGITYDKLLEMCNLHPQQGINILSCKLRVTSRSNRTPIKRLRLVGIVKSHHRVIPVLT